MLRHDSVLALLILLLASAVSQLNLEAQEKSWEDWTGEALQLAAGKQTVAAEKAEKLLRSAREELREQVGRDDHPRLVEIMIAIGIARQHQNKNAGAETAYRSALAYLQKQKPNHNLTGEVAFRLVTSMYEAQFRALGNIENPATNSESAGRSRQPGT